MILQVFVFIIIIVKDHGDNGNKYLFYMEYDDYFMINTMISLGLLKIIVDAISPKKILF